MVRAGSKYVDNVNELGYMHTTDQVPYAWCVIFNVTSFLLNAWVCAV